MRKLMLIVFLLFPTIVHSQNQFRLSRGSKNVDVGIELGECGEYTSVCGPAKIRFFRKGQKGPFQVINLKRTCTWDAVPKANVIRRYDDQSTINFGDFNFDGAEDVAICDGADGGYGMPSYRVYLYSRTNKRFIYSRSFTKMNEGGLGMFATDVKRKVHYVFRKDTCCWHQTQGFDVYRGKPRQVYELTEDSAYGDGSIVEVSTGKLIRGRWREWIRHVKASDYYRQE